MTLEACPCGQTPKELLMESGISARYGYAYGSCCEKWRIEFKLENGSTFTVASNENAVKAWNEAPRASEWISSEPPEEETKCYQ